MNLLNLKMEGPLSGEMSYIVIMQEGALDENEGTWVLDPVQQFFGHVILNKKQFSLILSFLTLRNGILIDCLSNY